MAAEILNERGLLKTVTPMMRQYLEVKEQYPDHILMYRLGDFYECFFEDAVIASRELGLTLTSRDCGDGKRAAMCGVPFHKADQYIAKLVEKGIRVSVCEQIGDPKAAVGLVKREVTRVVTPGTVTDASVLNESKNNFLTALCFVKDGVGVATADITTGEVYGTYLGSEDYLTVLKSELGAFAPSEIIINAPESYCKDTVAFARDKFSALIIDGADRLFGYERAKASIARTFGDEAERISSAEISMALGALLSYIEETQKTEISFVKNINIYSRGQYLELDLNTRRNLELTEAMRTKEKRGSLLWVLDKPKRLWAQGFFARGSSAPWSILPPFCTVRARLPILSAQGGRGKSLKKFYPVCSTLKDSRQRPCTEQQTQRI